MFRTSDAATIQAPRAAALQQSESEWSQLIAMLELTQRWHALIGEFRQPPLTRP